jgi:hypothetical protein
MDESFRGVKLTSRLAAQTALPANQKLNKFGWRQSSISVEYISFQSPGKEAFIHDLTFHYFYRGAGRVAGAGR